RWLCLLNRRAKASITFLSLRIRWFRRLASVTLSAVVATLKMLPTVLPAVRSAVAIPVPAPPPFPSSTPASATSLITVLLLYRRHESAVLILYNVFDNLSCTPCSDFIRFPIVRRQRRS